MDASTAASHAIMVNIFKFEELAYAVSLFFCTV